jgi:hypothetical protein
MELAEALKLVINDIANDPTWLEKPKKKTLRMLNQRLMELETIWAIPDELWNDTFDEPDEK